MKILVTGSSGHLGEALVRTFRDLGNEVIGLDVKKSASTTIVGSVTDRSTVKKCTSDVELVYHTATLHKPHIATHSMQDFVDTNVSGTLALLEAAKTNRVRTFVFTSTTSVFGNASRPPPGTPAAWITENVDPIPKNIYGVTKTAAEDLCHLFHRQHGLNCIILRTSRLFPEQDDDKFIRENYNDNNAKTNEFLVGGHTLIGYGGAQTLEEPSGYSDVVKGLLADLDVDLKRFNTAYDQGFYRRRRRYQHARCGDGLF